MTHWFDFLRSGATEKTPAPSAFELPVFPLNGVLFPGGLLSLKVFEQRYLDMAAACMKAKTPFGVCLIRSGSEVGEPAEPYPLGTLAHVVEGDMAELGILMLKLRGGERFHIEDCAPDASGIVRARARLVADAPPVAVPERLQSLLPFLRRVVAELGEERIAPPHAFDDAAWVGYRLCEIVPVQALARQKLLELTDPVSRLEILHAYLKQRALVD